MVQTDKECHMNKSFLFTSVFLPPSLSLSFPSPFLPSNEKQPKQLQTKPFATDILADIGTNMQLWQLTNATDSQVNEDNSRVKIESVRSRRTLAISMPLPTELGNIFMNTL